MMSQAEDAQAKIQARADMSAAPAVKHSFTRQHFRAASFFATSAAGLESEICAANQKNDIRKPRHRAYVVGAIVSAVMGLEACTNEIYLDAVDGSKKKLLGLSEQEMGMLAEWWPQLERQRADALLKSQHALLLLGKLPLPKGRNPYQDADHLIHLRNALTHYKSEWDDALDKHGDLQSRLTGKFDLNPLSTKNALWFPHQCLGSGCAKWAVNAAEAFVRAFCKHLGIAGRI
jgi:hypothetical protein